MNFTPKRPMALKITEVPSLIYLSLLVERLGRIKVRVLQNFEDFSSKHSIKFIHLMMHEIFKISIVVPLL